MSSIINALRDLVSSLVELVWSFVTTAGELVQKTAQFALNFATELLDLVVNFFRGLVDLAGGIAGFIFGASNEEILQVFRLTLNPGNVLMLGVVAAAVFGFLQYQRSQGRQVTVGNKKLN
jgi:hypothetical protein